MSDPPQRRVRLDKWLWAARFYKTRSQAAAAIKSGRVDIDGARAKPSHQVGTGTRMVVRKGPFLFDVSVTELAERRGSAERAQQLYVEDPASVARREERSAQLAAEHAATPRHMAGQGRPTKKQRRDLMAFRERYLSPEDWADDDDAG